MGRADSAAGGVSGGTGPSGGSPAPGTRARWEGEGDGGPRSTGAIGITRRPCSRTKDQLDAALWVEVKMETEDAEALREAWKRKGSPACPHDVREKEFYLESATGSEICIV